MKTCVLIDGHALIQALGKPDGCQTFGDYAEVFMQTVTYHTELMWYLTAIVGMPQSKQWPGQRVQQEKANTQGHWWTTGTTSTGLEPVHCLRSNKASLAQFISEVIMEEEKGKDLPERFDLVTRVDSQMLRMQDQRGEMMSVFKQTTKRPTPGWYSIHVSQLTKVTKECWSSAETQMFCFFWFISCQQKQLKCGWSLEQQRSGNVTQYMVYDTIR